MTPGPPTRRRVRTRLAIGMTISTLLVAATVAVAATALAAWQSNDTPSETQAGAARIGDDVTVVIVSDESPDAAAEARRDTLRWSLVALAASIIPAVAVGWLAAGRMLGGVDQALAEIESAEEERQRRLQDVVHELRTPLAVMSTNLELAVTDPATDSEAAGFIEAARRAVDRMDRTVDDLAGHGRLAVDQDAAPVDLRTVAAAAVEEHAGPAQTRGIHLMLGEGATTVVHGADRAAVQTAVGNLLANAVRLAPAGSSVKVDWGADAGWGWIAIADEGPGLAFRHHARVFERGWRGRHERDRGNGTGLGLTIARQLTEAQGGQLTLDSDEGSGSTFTVWLPLSTRADAADIVAPDGIHPTSHPWVTPTPATSI